MITQKTTPLSLRCLALPVLLSAFAAASTVATETDPTPEQLTAWLGNGDLELQLKALRLVDAREGLTEPQRAALLELTKDDNYFIAWFASGMLLRREPALLEAIIDRMIESSADYFTEEEGELFLKALHPEGQSEEEKQKARAWLMTKASTHYVSRSPYNHITPEVALEVLPKLSAKMLDEDGGIVAATEGVFRRMLGKAQGEYPERVDALSADFPPEAYLIYYERKFSDSRSTEAFVPAARETVEKLIQGYIAYYEQTRDMPHEDYVQECYREFDRRLEDLALFGEAAMPVVPVLISNANARQHGFPPKGHVLDSHMTLPYGFIEAVHEIAPESEEVEAFLKHTYENDLKIDHRDAPARLALGSRSAPAQPFTDNAIARYKATDDLDEKAAIIEALGRVSWQEPKVLRFIASHAVQQADELEFEIAMAIRSDALSSLPGHVPLLVELLEVRKPEIVSEAISVLAKFESELVLPHRDKVIATLKWGDERVCISALWFLREHELPAERLGALFEDIFLRGSLAALAAADLAREMGVPAEVAVPAMRTRMEALLKTEGQEGLISLMEALAEYRGEAVDQLDFLVAVSQTEFPDPPHTGYERLNPFSDEMIAVPIPPSQVPAAAVRAIAAVGGEKPEAVRPALWNAFSTGSHFTRRAVVEEVEPYLKGPHDFGLLHAGTADEDEKTQEKAVGLLARHASDAYIEEAVEKIAALASHENEHLRLRAARLLGRVAESTPAAEEALRKLIDDKNRDVAVEAAHHFAMRGKLDPSKMPVLARGLELAKDETVAKAALALRIFGKDAEAVLPELADAVRGASSEAARTVELLGKSTPEIVEAYAYGLDDRWNDAFNLRHVVPAAKLTGAPEALAETIRDLDRAQNPEVRTEALKAFRHFNTFDDATLEATVDRLQDEDTTVAEAALETLRQRYDGRVREALERAATSLDQYRREAAKAALEALQPNEVDGAE